MHHPYRKHTVISIADILLSAHAILSRPYDVCKQPVNVATALYGKRSQTKCVCRACRHRIPFDGLPQALSRYDAHAQVLRSSQHNKIHPEPAGKDAFLLGVDSHIDSSAHCGVLICFVCLAVTLCTAAHLVAHLRRVQQARNATQLCPFMPVLCWHPTPSSQHGPDISGLKPNLQQEWDHAKKQSSRQHSGHTTNRQKGLVEV